jgi:predicted ester cyclase
LKRLSPTKVYAAWSPARGPAFPDYHEELLDLIAEDDKVVMHLRISGTQRGAWGLLPPTGRRVEYEEIVIIRIADGKVVHQRGIADNLNALQQLGVVPMPHAPGKT